MQHSNERVSIIATERSWIEGEAVAQLESTAKLPGVVRAVGLPDLHPGRGTPIGAVFFGKGVIYPHLVGSDVGCGMALFRTGIEARSAKLDRFARKLHGLEEAIGGGNHFAELIRKEHVIDETEWAALRIDPDELMLLVHSGSRALGEAILRAHTSVRGAGALDAESQEGRAYLEAHDEAVDWARENRARIAEMFLGCIGGEPKRVLDICHNSVTRRERLFIHRKGAAPHEGPAVIVPGSRGSLSYLMIPLGDGANAGFSIAHGAGRKWKRSEARDRIRTYRTKRDLERTSLGGRVLCEDPDLLYEEAPEAYKDITRVIADLEEHGVCRTIAMMRPVLTYKVRKSGTRGTEVSRRTW